MISQGRSTRVQNANSHCVHKSVPLVRTHFTCPARGSDRPEIWVRTRRCALWRTRCALSSTNCSLLLMWTLATVSWLRRSQRGAETRPNVLQRCDVTFSDVRCKTESRVDQPEQQHCPGLPIAVTLHSLRQNAQVWTRSNTTLFMLRTC